MLLFLPVFPALKSLILQTEIKGMNRIEPFQYISELKGSCGRTGGVAWLGEQPPRQQRPAFIVLRDGTGFAQCVVNMRTGRAEQFEAAETF